MNTTRLPKTIPRNSDQTSLFNLLPAESAQRLLEISSDKHIPFTVKEMKQALRFKGLRGVEKVDPSWIMQVTKGESPRS